MNAREAGMQGIAGYLACSHGQGIVQLSAGICPVRTGTETGRAVSVELSAGYLACLCRHGHWRRAVSVELGAGYLACLCRHGHWRRAVSVELSAGYLAFSHRNGNEQSRVNGAQCRLFGLLAPARSVEGVAPSLGKSKLVKG